MSKDKHKNSAPFGRQPVKAAPAAPPANLPEKDEDATPHLGVRIPPGTITPAIPPENPAETPPEDSDKDQVSAIEAEVIRQRAERVALKAAVRDLGRDLKETREIAIAQAKEITALQVKLADLVKSEGMTEDDVKALFAMCAEITFDRTRNGEAFTITLKGRRSHTQGKIGRFGNFQALLTALRARK